MQLLVIFLLNYIFFVHEKIISVKAVASISSWCVRLKRNAALDFAYDFMWNFFWKTIMSPSADSEVCFDLNGL